MLTLLMLVESLKLYIVREVKKVLYVVLLYTTTKLDQTKLLSAALDPL